MNFNNNSTYVVRLYVYSAFPTNNDNLVAAKVCPSPSANSIDLKPGDYYVRMATGEDPGTEAMILAASGGVSSDSTVTLAKNLRLTID